MHALGSLSLAVQPNCLKGRLVCGTVYGEMHLKDLLGSLVRVGYRIPQIPVPDFYLVLHGLRCRKITIMGLNQTKLGSNSNTYPCVYMQGGIIFMMFFGKTRPGRELTTYRVRGGHAYH